jgi:predicted GIY-YIG superfamily endonuclease
MDALLHYCYVYVLMSETDGRWYTGSTVDSTGVLPSTGQGAA